MNIDMPGPFWRNWEWSFWFPLSQYDYHLIYSILHKRQALGPVLNSGWLSYDKESRWIQRLHRVSGL